MDNEIWLIIVIIESAILTTMFFIIGFYKNFVIEEIKKRVKEKEKHDKIIEELNTKIENDKNTLNEHKEFVKLQEIEIEAGAEVDRLINLIDEATPKVSEDDVSAKYKLDFENKFIRIIAPQNTFKLVNDTDSDLMISVTKIVSDTIITDSKPYFMKLRKTNHIDIEQVSSLDTSF